MRPARCADESRRVVAALQARYAEETQVRGLKIRHNNVLGYFVEVTAQHGDKLMKPPLSAGFIHRQTLAGQVRFNHHRARRPRGQDRQCGRARARPRARDLRAARRTRGGGGRRRQGGRQALAATDVAAALAMLAAERDYVRPQVDAGIDFAIEGGRHPWSSRRSPTARSCQRLRPLAPPGESAGRIYVVTGPNMAANRPICGQTR